MDASDQINEYKKRIDQAVAYARHELEISIATLIGTLVVKCFEILYERFSAKKDE